MRRSNGGSMETVTHLLQSRMPSGMALTPDERENRPASAGRCARARIRSRISSESIRDGGSVPFKSLALYLYSRGRRRRLLHQPLGKPPRERLDLEDMDGRNGFFHPLTARRLRYVAPTAVP